MAISVVVLRSALHMWVEGALRPCPEFTSMPPIPVFLVEYSPGPGSFEALSMDHSTSDLTDVLEMQAALPALEACTYRSSRHEDNNDVTTHTV